MDLLLPILGLAFIGSVAGLIGGVIFLFKESWAKTLSVYSIPFAVGVLISLPLVDLIPEAIEQSGDSDLILSIILFVIVGVFLIEQFLVHFHHHEKRHHETFDTVAPLIVFGDTVHNFLDGIAIAAAYIVNPTLGITVALATFLHETPHEIADFGILLRSGWDRFKVLWVNFASALSTFAGAIFVLLITNTQLFPQDQPFTPIFLAISSGLFLYIGASDLLPEIGNEKGENKRWAKASLLVLGVFLIFILNLIFPD